VQCDQKRKDKENEDGGEFKKKDSEEKKMEVYQMMLVLNNGLILIQHYPLLRPRKVTRD
jgi:hypothetical protein